MFWLAFIVSVSTDYQTNFDDADLPRAFPNLVCLDWPVSPLLLLAPSLECVTVKQRKLQQALSESACDQVVYSS